MAEVIPEAMNEANPAAEALANIASFCLNYWKKPHSYIHPYTQYKKLCTISRQCLIIQESVRA